MDFLSLRLCVVHGSTYTGWASTCYVVGQKNFVDAGQQETFVVVWTKPIWAKDIDISLIWIL
jgi:hypothetical protein